MTTRILIVDDHEIVREGLKSHLAKSRPDWDICGEASDGEQAIQLAQELKPDILILDITMPRMSGLEASSRMRKAGLSIPVLIFTTHDSERLAAEVRQAGAQRVRPEVANCPSSGTGNRYDIGRRDFLRRTPETGTDRRRQTQPRNPVLP